MGHFFSRYSIVLSGCLLFTLLFPGNLSENSPPKSGSAEESERQAGNNQRKERIRIDIGHGRVSEPADDGAATGHVLQGHESANDADETEKTLVLRGEGERGNVIGLGEGAKPAPVVEEKRETSETETEILAFLASFERAWEASAGPDGRIGPYIAHFSQDFRDGTMNRAAFEAEKAAKNRRKEWIRICINHVRISEPAADGTVTVRFLQIYESSNYADQTEKTLVLRREGGQWKIIGFGEQADLRRIAEERREKAEAEIMAFLASFERTWEASAGPDGRIGPYIAHFSTDFRDGTMDRAAFEADKAAKNRRKEWIRICIGNVRISEPTADDTVTVRFLQTYDSSNYADQTQKTLVLRREDGQWKIIGFGKEAKRRTREEKPVSAASVPAVEEKRETPEKPASAEPVPAAAEKPETPETEMGAGEIYVDQVIDEESLARELEAEERASRVIFPEWSPGSMGVTYRYYNNDVNDRAELTEHGVELRWRQETQENGSYEIQVDGLNSDGYDPLQEPDGHRIQVRQNNFVINTEWQLDSDLFNYRSVVPRLITESYRFRLPSTILQGMGNRIYSKDTAFFLNFGEIGKYQGLAAKAYETTQGSLQGVGVQHRLSNQWAFAAQFWNTQDSEYSESHQSLAGALQYQPDRLEQNHQLHLLSDSNGNTGLWYDAHLKIGRWDHRAGAQYLPPELLWTDVPINNDRQGLYWLGERKSYRWFWNFGTEIGQSNLGNNPDIAGYISTATFGNFLWQYRRRTQIGGGANVQTQTADSGTATDDSSRYLFKTFVSHRFPIGRTRIEPQWELTDRESEQSHRYGLLWDQDWESNIFDRLSSSAGYYTTSNREEDVDFRIYVEKYLPWDLRLNGSFQQLYGKNPGIGVTEVSSFSLGLGWQFLRNWLMSVNADYNTGNYEPENGSDAKIEGTNVLFSVSYNIDTGKQPALYGADTDELGRGRIVGRVFLDENGNGFFDIGEEPLPDITVYLDGRFTTETGPKGRFEFWPVPAGEHYLTIALRDVPLPWILMDEGPQRVVVPVRGQAEFRFGLVRLDE